MSRAKLGGFGCLSLGQLHSLDFVEMDFCGIVAAVGCDFHDLFSRMGLMSPGLIAPIYLQHTRPQTLVNTYLKLSQKKLIETESH
jgi:hypothetical protein